MQFLRTLSLAAAVTGTVLTGLTIMSPAPAAAQSGGRRQEVRIQTRLTGGAINGVTPSGSARFRSRGTSSNFSVEVEDVNLPDGTKLNVTLMRGTTVIPAGSLTLALRLGEIDVNTNDGDIVPQGKAGDIVVVSDAGGAALMTGVLR
jgi:hypothetical protein